MLEPDQGVTARLQSELGPAEQMEGAIVRLVIEGPSGGSWDLAREEQHWALGQAGEDRPQALTRLDEDTAWRVFTKGLTPEQARRKAVLEGDPILAAKVLETVSILA